MNDRLELQVRRNYGVPTIYPMNDQARRIVKLTGKKTLSTSDVHDLMEIGFQVAWVSEMVVIPS